MNPLLSFPTPQESLRFRRPHNYGLNGFPPTGLPSPAIPGLRLWLDAGRGVSPATRGRVVTEIADQAGQSGLWTQPTAAGGIQPIYDDSSYYGPRMTTDGLYATTYFNPVTPFSFNRQSFSFFIIGDHPVQRSGIGNSYYFLSAASGGSAGISNVSRTLMLQSGGGSTSSLLVHTSRALHGFVGSTKELRFYRNTTSESAAALTAGEASISNLGGASALLGACAGWRDILFFNRPVTEDEVFRVLMPWARTRGVLTEFDGTLLNDGDSISKNIGTAIGGWQTRLKIDDRIRRVNVAFGGIKISDMVTNGAAVCDIYLPATGKKVLICFAGTNDLNASVSGTTTYNSIVTYCQARQAAGWKVVVFTILPRSDFDATRNTEKATCNSNIAANWATFADGFVDVNADTRLQTPSDPLVYIDGIHPTDLGHSYIAEDSRPEIMRVLAA